MYNNWTDIYITDVISKKILMYTSDGTFQGDAIGAAFFRMTYGGDYLYATVLATKFVHVYNIRRMLKNWSLK